MKPKSSTYPYTMFGDTSKAPYNAFIYDGSSTAVPKIEQSAIVLVGAIGILTAQGIGTTGYATKNGDAFRIPYEALKVQGAGVKIRTSLDSQAQKMRFGAVDPACGEHFTTVSIHIETLWDAQFPGNTYTEFTDFTEVNFQCGCAETACQLLEKLAKKINEAGENMPVTALFTNVGDVPQVEITSKVAGRGFRVRSFQGITRPKMIVPNTRQYFTAADVQDWFGKSIPLLAANPTKKLTAVQLIWLQDVETTGSAGVAGSSYDTEIYTTEQIQQSCIIFFDPATSDSNTAFNTLKTILTGTNEYNRKIGSTTSDDFNTYDFTIKATDAGNAAALTAARAAYTGGVVSLDRIYYVNGVSYYNFRTTTQAQAANSGIYTVSEGSPDLVADVPAETSVCPAPQDSLCIGC